jgi:hypothetical protein
MLDQRTIDAALEVPAFDQSVGRAVIDGAVLIYDHDATPEWASRILTSRDDDGNTMPGIQEDDD